MVLVKGQWSGSDHIFKVEIENLASLMWDWGVSQTIAQDLSLFCSLHINFPSCLNKFTVHQDSDDCQLHFSPDPKMTDQAILEINSALKHLMVVNRNWPLTKHRPSFNMLFIPSMMSSSGWELALSCWILKIKYRMKKVVQGLGRVVCK